ncbi:MAG: SPOR domain-containing protein [Acidobacteria bacterium]|nr:SPOR domain-containing protein [Acidobacteriota bacterium]
MAHHTRDDGFHEIQLNGKQLVFLFMAATVVSVVIFLCGVLVGRGVVAERGGAQNVAAVAAADPVAAPGPSEPAPPAVGTDADPRRAAPPETIEDLTYFDRLDGSDPPEETLKPVADTAGAPARPAATSSKPAAKTAARTEAASPGAETDAAAAPTRPATVPAGVYTVQVAALNARPEAESIAKRLAAKGYDAYVAPPGNGALMFRVRVGRFKTRREAEPVSARLQKEEQFKPWITR